MPPVTIETYDGLKEGTSELDTFVLFSLTDGGMVSGQTAFQIPALSAIAVNTAVRVRILPLIGI